MLHGKNVNACWEALNFLDSTSLGSRKLKRPDMNVVSSNPLQSNHFEAAMRFELMSA